MKIAIAADHAGINLKAYLIKNLPELQFQDFGPATADSVDYPDFAALVGRAIQDGKFEKGILICGSGVGMSIAANKMAGIRAVLAESIYTAQLSAEHNDANVLCLGERITGTAHAAAIVRAWLAAEFGGAGADEAAKGRHRRRIEKIHNLEK